MDSPVRKYLSPSGEYDEFLTEIKGLDDQFTPNQSLYMGERNKNSFLSLNQDLSHKRQGMYQSVI